MGYWRFRSSFHLIILKNTKLNQHQQQQQQQHQPQQNAPNSILHTSQPSLGELDATSNKKELHRRGWNSHVPKVSYHRTNYALLLYLAGDFSQTYIVVSTTCYSNTACFDLLIFILSHCNTIISHLHTQNVPVLFRFFQADPDALPIFSFGRNTKLNEEFFKSPRMMAHARFWMKTFSVSVDMMGPDLETMYETLTVLGNKHERLGVTPEHYRLMGVAFVDTMEELLGDQFTPQCKKSWEDMWNLMADTMMRGVEEGVKCTRRR